MRNAVSTTQLETFAPRLANFAICRRRKKKKFSPLKKSKNILKNLLWVCRLQFWIPCPKVFQHWDKKSSSNVQRWEIKNFFFPEKKLKKSYRHVECTFDIFARKVSTKSGIFSPKSDSDMESYKFLEKI